MKPYLKKFLEELPHQTIFDHMEVILDHNEPDDEEILWVQEFQTKYPNRIKHIIVRPVEVIGASMNRCIKEASGKYVAIWNVDDLRTPNSLESQVQALEEKNGDIAIGDYRVVRSFGEKTRGKIMKHRDVPSSEFTRSMYHGPFVMFKKSLCGKAGYFDEQLTSGADFDLCIRLSHNGKVVVANDLLGYYLNEGKGASTRPGSKQVLDRTVIELRYGIFDKIDVKQIPYTVTFLIPQIISFGGNYNVAEYIPNYQKLLSKERDGFIKAMTFSTLKTLTSYSEVKYLFKTKIKAFLLKYKIL
jgi:glycosyltransferase involved in cell wall biosynthesis